MTQAKSTLDWLPKEHRKMYRDICRTSGVTKDEAKRVMLDHLAVIERRKARAA